ncbi:MAG: branched-chain amino acid ABC transporter permease [Thermodesulfobacteriota bacterium]
MTSSVAVQSIVNGLMSGWIYILVALGLTLVLSITGIVMLAHGEMYMIGAYVAYLFAVILGLHYFVAIVASMILVGSLGIVLERFLFRRLRHDVDRALILAISLIIGLQTVVVLISGTSSTLSIPSPIQGVVAFAGFRLSWERVITIIVSVVLVAILLFFVHRTKTGQAMLAVSQDSEAAALQGVKINRVYSTAMFLGCALAAAAGALVGAIFSLTPHMGSLAITKGIAAIILGGLGSIWGVIIGGLILGLIDGVVPPLLSVHMADIMGFIVIIVILLVRPQGLLGHE